MNERTTRLLLICGAVGAPPFVIVALIEGFTRPGYDPMSHFVSELSLSDQGWEQIANFIVCGLLLLAFAVGVHRVMPSGKGSIGGPILLGIFGLCLIVAGLFSTDAANGYPAGETVMTPSWHGIIHAANAIPTFGSLAAACFVLARRFAGDPATKGWAVFSIICGLLVVASFVLTVSSPLSWGLTGLFQRVGIIAGWGWVMLLALRLLNEQRVNVQSSNTSVG